MEPESVGKVIGETEAKQKVGWKAVAAVVLLSWCRRTYMEFLLECTKDRACLQGEMAFRFQINLYRRAPFTNMSGDPSQEFFSEVDRRDHHSTIKST